MLAPYETSNLQLFLASLLHVVLVVLVSLVDGHVFPEELIVIDIVASALVLRFLKTDSQLLLFPLLFVFFLNFMAVSVKTLSQGKGHANGTDELNKHNNTDLPVNTQIKGNCSGNEVEIERNLVEVLPKVDSLVH